jgi:MFS family permease
MAGSCPPGHLAHFFSQMILVPFLSTVLGMSDTAIIIIAIIFNTIYIFLEALMDKVWFLFLSWGVLQMLSGCMYTCALSAISKLAEPTEIGKFVSLIGLANTLIGLASAPAYNFIYQATLSTYPATALYVALAFFVLSLSLAIYTHLDMNTNKRRGQQEGTEEIKLTTDS